MVSTTRTRALVAALAATALLAGCSAGAGSSATSPSPGGTPDAGEDTAGSTDDGSGTAAAPGGSQETVRVGLAAEPASLDFTTTGGAAIPQLLMDNVYETLVTVDQTGEIVPALAES